MSILSKLFGGGGGQKSPPAEPEIYKDFRIFPEPMPEGGKFRIAARIEKDLAGEVKTHQLIRADLLDTLEDANLASIDKAKKMIDEQGDRIF